MQEEQQERIKAEKIRIALEKLRAARVKKLVVKVYNDEDPTSKTVAIDQTWTSWEVCKKMMRKNDTEPDPNWVLIERIPQLSIGWFVRFLFCFVLIIVLFFYLQSKTHCSIECHLHHTNDNVSGSIFFFIRFLYYPIKKT